MRDLKHISDASYLRQIATLYQNENTRLHKRLEQLQREIAELKGLTPEQLQLELMNLQDQLNAIQRLAFGASSEKSTPSPKNGKGKKQIGHGPTPQPELDVVQTPLELDDADRACPDCGLELEVWEGQYEESEVIDVVERRFVVVQYKRQKYHCTCGCIDTALPPQKLIPGGRYSNDFAIEVMVSKYADHLPLERQAGIMKREGLTVTSQTLWDQLLALSNALAPLDEKLRQHILTHACIGMDETTWRMLDKRGKVKGEKSWYVWSMCAPDAVLHRIEGSRSGDIAQEMLGDYDGRVMTDDFAGYSRIAKNGKFTHALCWAHVRRKFIDAQDNEPKRAKGVVALIDHLFRLERKANAPPEKVDPVSWCLRVREEESRSVVAALKEWTLELARGKTLPQSAFGKALAYMANGFDKLEVFLRDADIPLRNNAAERALRGVVVGRKNHYGSKSKLGTQVAARMYSIIETCKLVGVEPKDYIRTAVDAALDGREIPMPHELAEDR